MSSTCPKCSSDQWKSARLVIAEGTTNSTSSITGSITERGSMSINPKDWYLADRWFSYDSPIEADMSTSTSSLIVDQVKEMMVNAAEGRMLPTPPEEPRLISNIEEPKKRFVPKPDWMKKDPAQKTSPKPPAKPPNPVDDLEPFESRSWIRNYKDQAVSSFIWILLLAAFAMYFNPAPIIKWGDILIKTLKLEPIDHERFLDVEPWINISIPYLSEMFQNLSLPHYWLNILGSTLVVFCIFFLRLIIMFPSSFSYERKRKAKYDKEVQKIENIYQRALEKYQIAYDKYEDAERQRSKQAFEYTNRQEAYRKDLQEAELEYIEAMEEHKRSVQSEKEMHAIQQKKYIQDYNEYEAEVAQVRAFRNELWERARMCTRCGEMYLGDANLPT